MKKILLYLLLMIIAFFSAISVFGQDAFLRVMTFNIRYDNPEDGINRWDNRKQIVSDAIIEHSIDLAGMQEVLINQLNNLDDFLPGYRHLGVGRDDGKTAGEYVPIFYKYDRFRLLDNGTFWLSTTPLDTGSVGWDAALTRICTWGKFLDIACGQEFFFLNTHFDHMGDTARVGSARLILDFIEDQTNDLPVILTGDFNCSPEEKPYKVLINNDDGLRDVCLSSKSSVSCIEGTFNGFGSEKDPLRIDMIFIKGRWEVNSYEVLKIKDKEMFISDHWPIVTELKIEN
jgi:endonuclease/exonuclease/phosphatase family metal-dependent hydrolase